jgi:hypothetical protein
LTIKIHSITAQDATAEATSSVPNCAAVQPEATPTADATETPEATVVADQKPDAPLHFNTFLPTDVKFNPDTKKPVVVIMVFSLVFQNQLNQSINLRLPKFKLAIEGVDWGDIASTDFAMGQLLANATQGIVLQSLTFVSKTTDAQKTVLSCIENQRPVDLTLSGTMQVTVGDQEQTIEIELTSSDVIIQARKAQS